MKFIGGGTTLHGDVRANYVLYFDYCFFSIFECMLFSLTSNMEMFFNTIIKTNIQLKLSKVA